MEHHDVPLKLPAGLGVDLWADHDHALPDLAPLDLLEGERGRLSGLDLRDGHPLPVDGLDGDGVEVTQGVGSQQEGVVDPDGAPEVGAGHHRAHAGDALEGENSKFYDTQWGNDEFGASFEFHAV